MNSATHVTFPSIASLHELMDAMLADTLDPILASSRARGELADNPFVDAVAEMWRAVQKATDDVILRGDQTFSAALGHVMQQWERWKAAVGDKANALSDTLSKNLNDLLLRQLNSALEQMPMQLQIPNWSNAVASITTEYTLTITPSFEVALHRWLTLACQGGIKVTITYSRRTEDGK
jgi:hypothetical protein